MAKKRDTNLITSVQQLEMTRLGKSIIQPLKIVPTSLETLKIKYK